MKINKENTLFLFEQNYPKSPAQAILTGITRIKILLGQGVLFQT